MVCSHFDADIPAFTQRKDNKNHIKQHIHYCTNDKKIDDPDFNAAEYTHKNKVKYNRGSGNSIKKCQFFFVNT